MTCIVGIETDDGVLIAGDSAGTSDWNLTVRADEKVFERTMGYADFAFGFTSSFRMGQLLRYGASTIRGANRVEDPDAFMATKFVDWARETLKAGGLAKTENGVETGGTFLVGYAGRLYAVHDDFQVARPASGYGACGCGASVALGALYALDGAPARECLSVALSAAEALNAGVRGPFKFAKSRRA